MALDIHHIVGGVVIKVVLVEHAPQPTRILEVPVSREVNHTHAAGATVVRRMVGVAVEQGVVAARLTALAGVGLMLEQAQALVVQCCGVGALIDGGVLPVGRVVIPLGEQRRVALPGVEVGRQRGQSSIGHIAESGTHLGEHVEGALVQTLVLVLFAQGLKGRDEDLIEGQT